MSSAYKTLKQSDITVSPLKVNKSVSFPSCSAADNGIKAYTAQYIPVTESVALPAKAVLYNTLLNSYFNNWLSSSLSTGSLFDDNLQSTAASGTLQNDIRYIVNTVGSKIKVISVPQSIYGNSLTPKTIKLKPLNQDYHIIDDGNGNLIDIKNCISDSFNKTDEEIYGNDLFECIRTNNTLVGNVIYNQGLLLITNSDYQCIVDSGPTVYDIEQSIAIQTTIKTIDTLTTYDIDCSAINYNTLELVQYSGSAFPQTNITGSVIQLSGSLASTPGVYYTYYRIKSLNCAYSNLGLIKLTIYNIPPTPTVTPTITNTPTVTPTTTPTKTTTLTPTVTPTKTLTPSPTYTANASPTPTVTPSSTKTSTPTPTPSVTVTNTVTPTKTATPTNTPCTCECWNLQNDAGSPPLVSYTDCNGVAQNVYVYGSTQIYSCSTPSCTSNCTYYSQWLCSGSPPTPTPTVTPSITPSVTPSPCPYYIYDAYEQSCGGSACQDTGPIITIRNWDYSALTNGLYYTSPPSNYTVYRIISNAYQSCADANVILDYPTTTTSTSCCL